MDMNVAVYPLVGTVVRTSKNSVVIGNNVSLLVFGSTNNTPLLLTNMRQYEAKSGKYVDVDLCSGDTIMTQALALCQHKFTTSNNNYSITYSSSGCTVNATPKDASRISYTMQGPCGNIVTESKYASQELLDKCTGLRAFQYTVTTDTCERNVLIKRGQVEIFKEIAHYTGKSLVFTSLSDNKVSRELCITSTGCCEIQPTELGKKHEFRAVKVPFTRVNIDTSSRLSAVDCNLDVIMWSKCLSQALRGGS